MDKRKLTANELSMRGGAGGGGAAGGGWGSGGKRS